VLSHRWITCNTNTECYYNKRRHRLLTDYSVLLARFITVNKVGKWNFSGGNLTSAIRGCVRPEVTSLLDSVTLVSCSIHTLSVEKLYAIFAWSLMPEIWFWHQWDVSDQKWHYYSTLHSGFLLVFNWYMSNVFNCFENWSRFSVGYWWRNFDLGHLRRSSLEVTSLFDFRPLLTNIYIYIYDICVLTFFNSLSACLPNKRVYIYPLSWTVW
jgi:hypothetical protein